MFSMRLTNSGKKRKKRSISRKKKKEVTLLLPTKTPKRKVDDHNMERKKRKRERGMISPNYDEKQKREVPRHRDVSPGWREEKEKRRALQLRGRKKRSGKRGRR